MTCTLEYIPSILHTNDKEVVSDFYVGEEIYYRSKPDNLLKPYDNISLCDISHNRNFNSPNLYSKEYVLFNINEHDEIEQYNGFEVITFKIINLNSEITYKKEIISHLDDSLRVLIILVHRPEPCMYPHSVFEVILNSTIIDRLNYKKTLGKDNRTFSFLRTTIRQYLTSMVQTGLIDASFDIETLLEP